MKKIITGICIICAFVFSRCTDAPKVPQPKAVIKDTLTAEQLHSSKYALSSLTIYDGLKVEMLASEPMLKNPTNIDVDDRGRIWVNEAYNYRPAINNNPTNALGDRIMILEDRNGDGKIDTAKIFYQGPEINAPLGICVLGNRVIVSQSPYVWNFYDDDGDDKADRKEIMFEGIGEEQHDHGVHAFTFGPDGKLYFNMGNAGKTLKDKNGKNVLDQDGDVIGPAKYKEGKVFRCDPDGSHVECLAQNFRNPYEVAIDSYGGIWQSDNDDDGNRATRINNVIEYGNYGFTDEMTGAGWRASRTNMEDSIPLQHWHLNDPGEIPNLLQTGAGSPTGMLIYEGHLLPEKFYGQMIHCDAGPNIVRSYLTTPDGAGYKATIENILSGEKDKWFRPSDVCTAPDGSLIIADWYDPGVGGHAAGDQVKGRIYRVAPEDHSYKIQPQNYSTIEGALAALQNPNLAVRYKAWMALQSLPGVQTALANLYQSSAKPAMRARAFWLMLKMKNADARTLITEALHDKDNKIVCTAIRAAKEMKIDIINELDSLNNTDPQVLRQAAVYVHHNTNPAAATLWARLANQYNGHDRWYLEALGVGADKQWDKFMSAYFKIADTSNIARTSDLVWRSRGNLTLPMLAKLAADSSVDFKNRLKYFRAFDFNTGAAKSGLILAMIHDNNDADLNKLILHHLDTKTVSASPKAKKALYAVLENIKGSDEFLELITRYNIPSYNKELLQMAADTSSIIDHEKAMGILLKMGGGAMVMDAAKRSGDTSKNIIYALGGVGSVQSMDMLQKLMLSNALDSSLKNTAAKSLGHSYLGEEKVLALLKSKKVPQPLIPFVVEGVKNAWRGSVKIEAESFLPASMRTNLSKPAPALNTLVSLKGNSINGQKIFATTCSTCHKVKDAGNSFGPDLTEIGSKLPKEAVYNSIVYPSEGIGFGYEGWLVQMNDGSVMSGIISSKTKSTIDLKFPGGSTSQVKVADVKLLSQSKQSLMPDGLYNNFSNQDFSDLLEYLNSLKKGK